MVGWGPKMKYNEASGGSKVAITHIVPVKFVEFPHAAKVRFLRRSRRSEALHLLQCTKQASLCFAS